ncbi:hypothetical protein SH1V18_28400 [Vallitalea longa]|uniref:DUF4330 domain-containing protein n=1 Tax=Vallitalea longa TaxID=2936439 RepID=A0A9W6DFA0_9FIRM|nr:DUF4330 family protein [Vallitalea longa]GKX30360.1 hypothetical protein SH1V18_28400 [Vallitalea longa]
MKLVNKQGKLFGKIHLVDCIFIALIIILLVSVLNRFTFSKVDVITNNSQNIIAEITVETYPYRQEYLNSISVGDKIAESKKYLDGEIKQIDIIDDDIALIDNNGDTVVGAHPFLKKAKVDIEIQVKVDGNKIKLGNQELVAGTNIFLTTDKAYLSAIVLDINLNE